MDMATILFNCVNPLKAPGQAVSEKTTFKDNMIFNRGKGTRDNILIVTKQFYSFNHTL